jgi:hypothetical protein
VVNSYPEDEIAEIVYTYGEERIPADRARDLRARSTGLCDIGGACPQHLGCGPPEYRRGAGFTRRRVVSSVTHLRQRRSRQLEVRS